MFTNWKNMNYNLILIIVGWLTKMIHYKPVQMSDALGFAEVLIDLIVWHGPPRPPRLDHTSRLSHYLKVLFFFVLQLRRQTNYDLILVIIGLQNKPMQISCCTRASGDNFRSCNLINTISQTQQPRLSLHLQVLVPWYHFRTRLRLPSMRHLWKYQLRISLLHIKRTFNAGLWHSISLSAGPLGLRVWI